jgi:hypothetical protein
MKHTLLITASVAALAAGIGLASAQGLNERRDAPAASASEQKAPDAQTDRQKSTLPAKTEKLKPAPTALAPEKSDKAKPAPIAQAPEKEKSAPTAQAPEKSDSEHRTVGQSPSQGATPGAAMQKGPAQKGTDSFALAPMSTEQHVKFRETMKGEKAERLTSVPFSISVGEEVPRTVHYYRLPARIVEYAPQYRDFDYILVGDDILILDPRTHRIVAVIPA